MHCMLPVLVVLSLRCRYTACDLVGDQEFRLASYRCTYVVHCTVSVANMFLRLTLLLFTQRTHDHEGLLSGASAAQCVPVFVFDPEALAAEGPVTVSTLKCSLSSLYLQLWTLLIHLRTTALFCDTGSVCAPRCDRPESQFTSTRQ
jgi:hypothetical protein